MTEPQQQPEHLDRGEATFRRAMVDQLTRVEEQIAANEKGANISTPVDVPAVLAHAANLVAGSPRIYGPLAPRVAALRERYDALVAHG